MKPFYTIYTHTIVTEVILLYNSEVDWICCTYTEVETNIHSNWTDHHQILEVVRMVLPKNKLYFRNIISIASQNRYVIIHTMDLENWRGLL